MPVIFGEPWDAPVCEGAVVGTTPVGEPCAWCTLPIDDSDSGIMIPVTAASGLPHSQPWHVECEFRSTCANGHHGGVNGPQTPQEVRSEAIVAWNLVTSLWST